MTPIEIRLEETQDNFTIVAEIKRIGNDLFIAISGGDSPHIGTVSAFTKTTCYPEICFPSHDGRFHKDAILAEKLVSCFQQKLPGNCVVTSGVHVNHITSAQIAASLKMAEQLGIKIAIWLDEHPFISIKPIY